MRYLRNDQMKSLQLRALANGGSVRLRLDGSHSQTVLWDVSGNCQKSVTVELRSRKELKCERFAVVSRDNPSSIPGYLEMRTRCRKCDKCLRCRAAMWRHRSRTEYDRAPRTWLCTLTLSPASVSLLLARCQVQAARAGVRFEELPSDDRFIALAKQGYCHVQKWLKRLRKNSGVPIRYLAITEAHKSGLPHFHVLLHEVEQEKPLRYKSLKGSWDLGRVQHYKLVSDAAGASYVTKYLSKSMLGRVRASTGYGDDYIVDTLPPLAEVA